MLEQLLAVGTISCPYGIKGEIRIKPYADPKSFFKDTLFLQYKDAYPKKIEVYSFRMHNGCPLLCFKGYSDRTSVQKLCGQTVLIPKEVPSNITDGSHYLSDMLGSTVILEKTGEVIGIFKNIAFPSGQELWSIMTPTGKEVFLPGVPEFIGKIDIEKKKIYIQPPKGLLELYL